MIIIEFKFEVTEEDYIKFNLYHAESSKPHKRTYNTLRYLLPLLFSVPIYATATSVLKQPKLYWIIIAVLFAVIWIVTYPKQYKRLIRRETEKILRDGDNSLIVGKKTMIIDDEEIKVITEDSSESTLKRGIKDIKIYDDMILIYLSGITAHIIPTRYLDGETRRKLLEKLGAA